MIFGFHQSVAGGHHLAFQRAKDDDCRTMQIFTRSPRGWKCNPLTPSGTALFTQQIDEAGIAPVVVHMPYLPNLASGDPEKHARSIQCLQEELVRTNQLNCSGLVTHIGKGLGLDSEEALNNVVTAVDTAIKGANVDGPLMLLENTAGQGTEVGNSVEELAYIFDHSSFPHKLGLCLDTCHAHAAGYDLSSAKGVKALLSTIDKQIGLDKLKVLHLNDSKGECGGRLDRHQHIGQGTIGTKGFKAIVNHPKLKGIPGIMETPVNDDGDNTSNLKTITSLVT